MEQKGERKGEQGEHSPERRAVWQPCSPHVSEMYHRVTLQLGEVHCL